MKRIEWQGMNKDKREEKIFNTYNRIQSDEFQYRDDRDETLRWSWYEGSGKYSQLPSQRKCGKEHTTCGNGFDCFDLSLHGKKKLLVCLVCY